MMTKEVYQILEEVAATSSKNEKESILLEHKDNETLKECFRLAYSPTIKFYIKKLPTPTENTPRLSLEKALEMLKTNIISRVITGMEAAGYIGGILKSLSEEDSSVVCRVILQDLKVGVKDATVNKVWKGLIVKPPRMGAASMNEKSLKKLYSIKNLAVELKSDGSYAASVCGEQSTMMSRNGSPLDIECLQEHLSCGAFNGFALEGELVYSLDKATRSEGNGIITKIVKGTASDVEKEDALLQVWDCIDSNYYQPKGEYPETNKDRRECLELMMNEYHYWCSINNTSPKIHLIERKENVSVEEAFEIFEQYVRDGYEGAIAKDMDATWKDVGKPAFNIKVKRKEPADLKVVDVFMAEEGSKYEGMLGGFVCESECGEIKVRVGSGFTDNERVMYMEECNRPPLIEVEYDSVTEDKKTKQKSLFLPIYKRPRYDKVEADTYEQILDKQRIK
jgi:ATP-dependent DNA ligase